VNQILRIPHNDVSSYEVIQLRLLFLRHDQELLSSPIDLDWFPGSQNMIEKPVEICSQPGRFHYHGRIVTPEDSYVNVYVDTYVFCLAGGGSQHAVRLAAKRLQNLAQALKSRERTKNPGLWRRQASLHFQAGDLGEMRICCDDFGIHGESTTGNHEIGQGQDGSPTIHFPSKIRHLFPDACVSRNVLHQVEQVCVARLRIVVLLMEINCSRLSNLAMRLE
jgi:hypothetical protein